MNEETPPDLPFTVGNKHVASSGTPLYVIDSEPSRHYGHFENEYGNRLSLSITDNWSESALN
jgi:hypothetical protein